MITQAQQLSPAKTRPAAGFTLVELIAVIAILLILVGLVIGIGGYAQKRMAITVTKAQIAAISLALESYKSDHGYYPRTSIYRLSSNGSAERTNNWYLYRALVGECTGCTKSYMHFQPDQLLVNVTQINSTTGMVNIVDVQGKPINYFCSPNTPFAYMVNAIGTAEIEGTGTVTLNNHVIAGGQMNSMSFDLFSYGPDKLTYSGTTNLFYTVPTWVIATRYPLLPWHLPESALDDITNWTP